MLLQSIDEEYEIRRSWTSHPVRLKRTTRPENGRRAGSLQTTAEKDHRTMGKYKVKLGEGAALDEEGTMSGHARMVDGEEDHPVRNGEDFTSKAATVGVVVVGAALFEAALIPGILIGAAAVLAPKYLPKLGERVQPLFNSTVRGAYKFGRKARSAVGEVREHVSDIAAEVHAEEAAAADGIAPAVEPAKA
ncbi:DUF5132 domain-containing protein [Paraburkholderia sp. Ac-20336]|uniref:DUF5132 domain-containing protein n=1 Tax=Paraburkholderia sp. Ac-20336 TaxID=2703886 RepID=UPI001981661B|nr:DUF5132 domain-containing protein [Paraburkholderia sp. Ac-20336]